jgi:parallel beta-helix repeat protein
MKKIVVLIFLALVSGGLAKANDIYLAQNPAGAANGSSCSAAMAISFFGSSANWGTGSSQIGPGTTVHLCGTLTGSAGSTLLTFLGSGTSSSPITLHFETGAGLTAPYWATTGAINTNGQHYLIIDGGSNGYVTATANGTSLGHEQDTKGLSVGGCVGCIVRNLTVSNMYVHTGSSSDGPNTFGIYVYGGSNNTITGNTVHDTRWGLFYVYPGSQSTTNAVISNNTFYHIDHGVVGGDGNGNGILSGFIISGNTFHDMTNWDDTADSFHHDYIHVWAAGGGSAISGVQIFNNYFYGDPGHNINTLVNIETQSGNTDTGVMIYNNVLTNSSTVHLPAYGYVSSGGTNISLYNNTIVGSSTSTSMANECFFLGGTGYKIMNNTCQNVGIFLVMPSGGSISSVDYNNWYNSGAGFSVNNSFMTFSAWRSLCSCDSHTVTTSPLLDSSYKPQSSSPVVKIGSNLTTLGVTTLNKDKAQVQRVSSGSWDLGAYTLNGASSSAAPNPPSGLAASVQ